MMAAIICYSVTEHGHKSYELAEDRSLKQRMLERNFPLNLYIEWSMPDRSKHFHCRPKMDGMTWYGGEVENGRAS